MVILTPATAPPCESVTVPAIRPKMLWAAAVSAIQVVNKTANKNTAVFNTNSGNSPPQTTWFDLDSFIFTRTPPSKKLRTRLPPIPTGRPPFFFPPRFRLAVRGKSRKAFDSKPCVPHCETASHSLSGSEKSPASAGRRYQIRLPRCPAHNFERHTFVPQLSG